MLHYLAPALPARAAMLAAVALADASRRLYALPLACPMHVYRAAVHLAEWADAAGDAARAAAQAHYAAALLGTALTWRRCAHGEPADMAGFYRAMARARIADARQVLGRGSPFASAYVAQ